jgi:hypothetical protein
MLLIGCLVSGLGRMAYAFPDFGGSCKNCHGAAGGGSDRANALAVLGEGLLNLDALRNDGSVRGAIPYFTGRPGDTIALTMNVLDGTDLYAVQFKRLEKAGILSPVANTNFLTGYTADGSWVPQAGPPAYFTSVADSTVWPVSGPSGPDSYAFALTLAMDTPLDTYDLEFAVAGRLDVTSRLKFYGDQHFYLTVVPEPGTFALMVLGFAGVGLTAWRQRSRIT